jgi:hypothetical protein
MNSTIIRFTAMSACLDPLKILYVALIGFVMPIGMKVASVLHGASDSQTFEMLTGKVGVAFVMMVLCLGLAGNTATQSGRGGEYLPLIFTRPISRSQYILSKWLTLAIIGGGFTALQNLVIAAIGLSCGESVTGQALLSMVLERFLDAALISAAMILTMMEKNPAFQIVAILAFYVWLTGQTIPPVSIATGGNGIQDLSIEATKIMLSLSQTAGQAVLPTLNIYDLISNPSSCFSPLIAYVSALTLYLVLAIKVTNRREFFYGTN